MMITFTLNGEKKTVDVPGTKRVIDLLREHFGLQKTKASCYQGSCGNCSILLDDHIVSGCTLLAFELKDRSVMTAEGYMKTEEYQRINRAFTENSYYPCDFCRWGKIFAIHEFIHSDEISNISSLTQALKGNQCTCTSPTLLLSVAEQIIKTERGTNPGLKHERIIRK
ncbi:MAG: 2Fe-2S iron-sulfur cluster-binding protein [Spirochaetia bacterium]|nr:2Fe-2S iron-sulfur cluster-binding protein [Spirochaetia bacterium]